MITLKNVNKYFNRHHKNEIHVINDISLELPETGLVALLGPSGCGKTTLLNAIGGLDKVKSGSIYVNGKKITRKSSYFVDKTRNLNIGYIFQNYNLIDDKTVWDNVALTLKMYGISNKDEVKKRVDYVLEKVGIYRYRSRYAGGLSGGERQRVGIARAIVKDPNIILADEPTGNLDSKNTIEIMNIIKAISKNRLVILVTHEKDIAKFYADRVIEIEDGKIKKDYTNIDDGKIDYRLENKIYLKDFSNINTYDDINVYSDSNSKVKLNIVVKNNNIYIQGAKNKKIEVVDENSNIELVNDHYKELDKSVYEKYEFDFQNIIDKNVKPKYKSIFNPISIITSGFRKVFDYSILKKILLFGFLGSGMFITYCVSNMVGITNVEDSYFIQKNRAYYDVVVPPVSTNDFLSYEQLNSVDYILPGSSNVSFLMEMNNFYQTVHASAFLNGSMTDVNRLHFEDILYGRLPENEYEIVVDKMIINKLNSSNGGKVPLMAGYTTPEMFVGMKVSLKGMNDFTIVGITSKDDPSIYINRSMFINVISNSYKASGEYFVKEEENIDEITLLDYTLNDINLKKGNLPVSDYEVIVNSNLEYQMPLGKYLKNKVNGHKLLVVGYYDSASANYYYVNNNTIKYNIINKEKNLVVMPKDDADVVSEFQNLGLNIISSYNYDKDLYIQDRNDTVRAGLIVAGVILFISFVEIYLMVRSSFLSRIKEIGIYRAIGVKKSDIYKIFFGEIFAITTIACVPGVVFMSFCIKQFLSIEYFKMNYMVSPLTVILSLVIIYCFNTIVGLLPAFFVVKNTPAQILSRKDLD